jgi:hypothetical protein
VLANFTEKHSCMIGTRDSFESLRVDISQQLPISCLLLVHKVSSQLHLEMGLLNLSR